MSARETNTLLVKRLATANGFDYCGIARAQQLDDDARRLEHWLHQGMHGNMKYMENYFDLRIDPTKLVPGVLKRFQGQTSWQISQPNIQLSILP